MVDRKIGNEELIQQGLIIDGVEILPPLDYATLSNLRNRRKIPYYKIAGRVYYQQSELIQWVEDKKTEIA